jgi:hypothetical protein
MHKLVDHFIKKLLNSIEILDVLINFIHKLKLSHHILDKYHH